MSKADIAAFANKKWKRRSELVHKCKSFLVKSRFVEIIKSVQCRY